jgi:nonsense-mediated mRNA decay protein 3
MGKKFCPKCGKEAEEFHDGLCVNCYLSQFSVIEKLPQKLIIKECKSCGKFFINGSSDSVENLVEYFLEDLLQQKEIVSASYRIAKNKFFLTLKVKKDDLEKTEEKTLDLIFKKIICQSCAMRESGYFQATLQVRAPGNLLPEIKDEIQNQINYLSKFDRLAFISNLRDAKNGFDVFIGSKNSANQIARTLKLKYKAKSKITRKLAGSVKGKKVYRETILISIS